VRHTYPSSAKQTFTQKLLFLIHASFKMQSTACALALSLLIALGATRDVPANVKALHDSIVKQGHCNNPLATGFYSQDGGKPG
jgi:hypothetical protein